MRLRRFTGATSRAALASVKATLGPDAVILASRPLAEGGVEITAAVDLDHVHAAVEAASAAERPAADLAAIARELGVLTARVVRLDRAMGPAIGLRSGLDEEAQGLAERIALNGTPPALAEIVARTFARNRVAGLPHAAALAASVERHLLVAVPTLPEPHVTAFVGPTGAGKTTTIAKRAAHALARGASVGLVMADTQRIGAPEQLGTYARLLGVPMVTVRDGAELVSALGGFERCDVVYVDTAGLTGDAAGATTLARLFAAAGPVVTTAAVVAAGASEGALRAAWRQLGGLAPTTAVVTKADEGGGIGGACGWLADVGVPLDWLGTGTRVPEDLAVADGAAVAAWLTAA
jgi:flagellar biosynthesis protein FlhF